MQEFNMLTLYKFCSECVDSLSETLARLNSMWQQKGRHLFALVLHFLSHDTGLWLLFIIALKMGIHGR
jgi:hypothetical protein